jgi:hypothetical protein
VDEELNPDLHLWVCEFIRGAVKGRVDEGGEGLGSTTYVLFARCGLLGRPIKSLILPSFL